MFAYLRTNGRLLRAEETINHSEYGGRVSEAGSRLAMVANPRGSFLAGKIPNQDGYRLRGIQGYEGLLGNARLDVKPLCAAYAVYGDTVTEFMESEEFEGIAGASNIEREGKSYIKVDWRLRGAERRGPATGWFIFDPNRHWALHEFKLEARLPAPPHIVNSTLNQVVEYEGEVDGVPLVKSVKVWSDLQELGFKPNNSEEFDVTSIKPAQIPEEQFTFSAFGLREPGAFTSRRRWAAVVLLIAFLLAIGAALYFALRARKQQRRNAASS